MSCNNTNSTCSNCSNNYSSCNNKCTKCGCRDSFLTSPPPCPTPQGCPDPIPCQEVLSSDCIIYNGPDVLCNGDIVVYSDATWTEILEDIVAYFCNALTNISSTVVTGGTNISVTSATVGNVTTYTVSAIPTFTYEIGEYVASEGGVIMHRWLSTISGGTPAAGTSQNYIVVDLNDLTLAQWASIDVDISNVESTYDGQFNTTNLIAAGAPAGITVGTAAELCDSSTAQGKTDWYLPAIDELVKLHSNRWEVAQGLGVGGGIQLVFNNYWSSTEVNISTAWILAFSGGNQGSNGKANSNSVRAVRRFSI